MAYGYARAQRISSIRMNGNALDEILAEDERLNAGYTLL